MSRRTVIILSVITAIFLLIANIGIWLERQIFDEARFKNTAVEVIKTSKVRNAIADEIIAATLGSLPELEELAEEFVQPTLSDFLDSDIIEPAIEDIAGQIQVALTSREPQAVEIDISGLTQPAKGFARLVPNLDPEIKSAIRSLPSSIELLEAGEIPSIYTPGIIFLWLGRVTGVAGLILIVSMMFVGIANRRNDILKTLGAAIAIGAAIFLVLIWSVKAPVLASVGDGNMQTIVGSIYEAFVELLIRQSFIILLGGLLIIALGYFLEFWRNRTQEVETAEDIAA